MSTSAFKINLFVDNLNMDITNHCDFNIIFQWEATSKLKTNVHTIEPIENNTENTIDTEIENSLVELNQHSSSLLRGKYLS